jgi:hypothetical protein
MNWTEREVRKLADLTQTIDLNRYYFGNQIDLYKVLSRLSGG